MAFQSGIQRRSKDETGKSYGKLTVLRPDGLRNGQPYFLCRCECGQEKSVRGANLRSGNTASCGCSRKKSWEWKRGCRLINQQFVFGRVNPASSKSKWVACCKFCLLLKIFTKRRLKHSKGPLCPCLKPTHTSWRNMIARCTNKNDAQFADYGGRGITVCDRWRYSFSDFVYDMKPRPCGTTLDRIDNDGVYERANCRWATYKEQAAHRRKPRRK